MKKNGILNSEISRVLSYMGHTDCIVIGDCGFPVPDETERVDLALAFGIPTFMQTLEIVARDMKIEKIILAEEIKEKNPGILREIENLFNNCNIETEFVSHSQLKEKTKDCKAVIIPIPETTVDKSNGINAVCHRWTSSPYDSMLSSSALTYIISAHHLCLLTF